MAAKRVSKGKIEIEYDEDSKQESKSKKTYMLGSSNGFQDLGEGVVISYNVIRKK
jgi:hypothetical protein